MKLYFMPGACSLAVHIALLKARLEFTLVEVDYATRKTQAGHDFQAISPKGYVPALCLDDGTVLTEVPVMLQYVDSLVPHARLLPAQGMDRLRALEWLNFLATEIHKSFSPLFRPSTPDAFHEPGRAHLCKRMEIVQRTLDENRYVAGSVFTAVDLYLYTLCRWLPHQEIDLGTWPSIQRHFRETESKRCVTAALVAETLQA